jgi:hypothetical protein
MTEGSERCCAYAGCTTRLSVYNSDFLCWTHADVRTRAQFEKVSISRARSEAEVPRSREPHPDRLWIGDLAGFHPARSRLSSSRKIE